MTKERKEKMEIAQWFHSKKKFENFFNVLENFFEF